MVIQYVQEHAETLKLSTDFAAVGTLLAVFLDVLPQLATILTVIWMIIRIIDSSIVLYRRITSRQHQDDDLSK